MSDFQEQIISLVRAFGWHRPGQTPCGQPVSVAEAHALLEISKLDGISQHELVGHLNLAKSTVSRIVTHMVERSWIVRQQDPKDRRAYCLQLTTQGKQVAGQLAEARKAKMERILERIPAAQRPQVTESLEILIKAIQAGE